MPSTNSKNSKVMNQQMSSLDDTDPLMSEWNDNLEQYQQLLLSSVTNQTSLKQQQLLWGEKGGRGRGGRGSGGGRVTIQPHDIIIPNISLEYVSDAQSGSVGSKTLLGGDDNTKLKLLSGVNDEGKHRVYALIGRNGCGKSTLLRRMHSKKIPGFINLNLKSMYIPQEVFEHDYQDQGGDNDDNVDDDNHNDPDQQRQKNPLEVILGYKKNNKKESKDAVEKKIQALEQELEIIMDSGEIDEEEMERVCNEISLLEDQLNQDENGDNNDSDSDDDLTYKVSQILSYFGIDEIKQRTPMDKLSGGQKKKVLLASTLFCDVDVLLLDEPTNHLDMEGIIQLRGLIQTMSQRQTIIVMVSHDVDLINSIATDVIHFANQTLTYYRGNYIDFTIAKNEQDIHKVRQQQTLNKQRSTMIKTIDNLKKQTASAGNEKKISRAVNNRKKKLERHGIEKDAHGHRWTSQKACTGIKVGSINSLDASTKSKSKNYSQLLKAKQADLSVAPIPEKEVQFKFQNTSCQWHEPLIAALDVGHGYELPVESVESQSAKVSMLFDSVDLCIDEKATTCILGENQSGKTTLLKILSGQMQPLEGKVQFAHNANISYFDQHKADNLIVDGMTKHGSTTSSISLLMKMYPKKSEQDIRSELISFGLGSQQASTYIQFLSGGERCRLCLVMLMLGHPHVLILDEPSNHLDPESVDALAHGIKNWNGTILLVSHDVHLIRQLDAKCYILMAAPEGKLKYVQGGIDSYLKTISRQESKKLED